MADGKRVKLTLKRRKVQGNGGNSSGSSDRASAEKSPRLGDGNAAAATAVFGSASSLTASSHEDTDPRIDSVPSEALGDGQGCVGRDGESAGAAAQPPLESGPVTRKRAQRQPGSRCGCEAPIHARHREDSPGRSPVTGPSRPRDRTKPR
ncbi:unnamed protein product [Lampetra fluviatilis]